jgi:hypothetical protein
MTQTDISIAKIEVAKALKAVQAIVSDSDFEKVRGIIAPSNVDMSRESAGLKEEDEFALMCRLMGITTHLVPLGQTPVFSGDYIVPDFLARFQPGCTVRGLDRTANDGFRCFIDVKSTRKNHFKIGGQALRARRAFADIFGLPLFFAVRLTRFEESALWIVVEDSDRGRNNLKATVSDVIKVARHVLWDEFVYMVTPGTHFRVSYTQKVSGESVVHPRYGEQVKFEVFSGDDQVSFSGTDAFFVSVFFEGFRLKEVANEIRGEVTAVIYAPVYPTCFIADLVYRMNRLPCDEAGVPTYNASKLLVKFQGTDEPPLITREMVQAVAAPLLAKKVLYVLGVGEEETLDLLWQKYGGSKSKEKD